MVGMLCSLVKPMSSPLIPNFLSRSVWNSLIKSSIVESLSFPDIPCVES